MSYVARNRGWLGVVAGFVLPLAVAALLVPLRNSFSDAAASLVLVASVTLVATVATRAGGYMASVSAALWFDFFLTRPYEQLVIDHRADIEITVSLLVVGVGITELAARSRAYHRRSRLEASYVGRIYQVSELVAGGAGVDAVVELVNAQLVELLHLRDCRFEPGGRFDRMKEIRRDGRVVVAGLEWPVNDWGLPGPQIGLVVLSRGQPVGRFVLTPTPGEGVAVQARLVAVALVDQVASLVAPHRHAA
jgi:K+-sensing histidine kinase KdpD